MRRGRVFAAVVGAAALALAGCTAPSAVTQATPSATATAGATTSAEVYTPVFFDYLTAPQPLLTTDGHVRLHYEVLLRNAIGQPIDVQQLSILDETGTTRASFAQSALAGGLMVPVTLIGPATSTILAGQQLLVMVDVIVADGDRVPTTLTPVVEITMADPQPPLTTSPMTVTGSELTVDSAAPVVIASPVRGSDWFWPNGCCEPTPHTLSVVPVNGQNYLSERFALDLVQRDTDGHLYQGDRSATSSYSYYGAEIHAVADGTIVGMLTNVPTGVPGVTPDDLELGAYAGNYIVQDIGGGVYALYAHLVPGDPEALRVGQHVTRGQVIGLLGTSGHSDLPHLHFQLMNSPNPLAAEGVPFVFDSFRLQGTVDFDTGEACFYQGGVCGVIAAGPAVQETNRFPLIYDVVDFGG